MGQFPEIRQFIEANIDSVEQLEALRILGSGPTQEWNADDLAKDVQTDSHSMASHLGLLHSRGLLMRVTRGTKEVWRHGPRTPVLENLVGRLLQLYQQHPVIIIRMVARTSPRTG